MKIPPFWARARYEGKDSEGDEHNFVASGWSFVSLQEARDEALARAKRIFGHMTGNESALERYEYHDRPIREEILREIVDDGGETAAVITRNRYGAEVLNCSQVLFVDVDFPKPRTPGFLESLMALFRGKKKEAEGADEKRKTIASVEAWASANPEHSFRMYRTKEGLRLLFTGKFYQPVSEETERILKELESDPLYRVLTRKQECFRARLTAKPWRCNSPKPPSSFPWEDEEMERAYRDWEQVYKRKDANFKVCELLGEFGTARLSGIFRTLVELHDKATRVKDSAPLA